MTIVTPEIAANPNARVFLNGLAAAEGTTTHNYATAYGGGVIPSLAAHPGTEYKTHFNGKSGTTSAAGRYQFEKGTFAEMQKQNPYVKDFGPQSQDIAALQLAANTGALDDILKGNLTAAYQKVGSKWASLPGSTIGPGQHRQTPEFMAKATGGKAYGQNMPAQTAPPAMQAQGGIAPAGSPITAAPTSSAAPTAPSMPGIPATTQNAIDKIFDAATKTQQPAPVVAAEPPELPPEPTDEQHQQLANASERDMTEARGQAQAKFFDEPYTPNFDLPPALDETINKYLAQL